MNNEVQGPIGDPGRVIVVGSINVDVFARVEHHPAPGETILGSGGEQRPGGKGANQALAAALCGARVSMVGATGNDANAAVGTAKLRDAGCNLEAVRTTESPTGLAMITVSHDGENSIIVIPGANLDVDQTALDAVEHVDPDDVVVLQGEISPEVSSAVALAAADRGARVIINLAPVVPYSAEALQRARPLVVNEHEGQGALALLGQDAEDEPLAIVRALRNSGVREVVMTLGGDGAVMSSGELDDVTTVPAKTVCAVDTTGAGDAFVGALAAGLSTGSTLADAVEEANRFAAETVQHEGAQDSYPDWRRHEQQGKSIEGSEGER